MTTRKAYVAIAATVIVGIVPPILVYMQAGAEMRARNARTEAEADIGYKTLVESVRELRATVTSQHDAIVKMQGYLEALRELSPSLRMTARPAALPKPEFHELPANLDAAQMKQ